MVMFLTLILSLGKEMKAMWHIYQQYLALRDGAVLSILPKAYSVASHHIEHIQLGLDEGIAPAMVNLATRLIEQALSSKQDNFNPRVRVASCGQLAGFALVALPMTTESPAVVKVMLTMNALAVFVAMIAYHRRIPFVTHPKVEIYKRKAMKLMAAAEVEHPISDPGPICTETVGYLGNNLRTRFVEVLCYGLGAGKIGWPPIWRRRFPSHLSTSSRAKNGIIRCIRRRFKPRTPCMWFWCCRSTTARCRVSRRESFVAISGCSRRLPALRTRRFFPRRCILELAIIFGRTMFY